MLIKYGHLPVRCLTASIAQAGFNERKGQYLGKFTGLKNKKGGEIKSSHK